LILWAVASLGHRLHRLEKVAVGIGHQRHARRIETPAILQFVLRIEAEEVGRALGAIGVRHLLCLIDNVRRKGEAMLPCECRHIFNGIRAIRLGVIWHDGDCIAIEDNKRALRSAHIVERIGFPVRTLEREVTGLPAELANYFRLEPSLNLYDPMLGTGLQRHRLLPGNLQ
jgi:hypothetical protein